MTSVAHWLIDKSALRLHRPTVVDALAPKIAAGRVSICLVTELEIGYSAQSSAHYEQTKRQIIDPLIRVIAPVAAEARAREVQQQLIIRGQHRAISIPDLLIAAIADVEGLVVLHYDHDFDLISDLTGQPTEWIVPSGTA